jgi:outer membrane lipoprotein-sorting protein
MPSFKTEYTYKMTNKNNEVFAESKGDILVKGDKFKLTDADREIFFNGTTVWVYERKVNEVNISSKEDLEGEITPANIYKMYQKGYKYIFMGQVKEGNRVLNTVDLEPQKRGANNIAKIRIFINDNDNSLFRIIVTGTSDIRQTYDIKQVTPNIKLTDATFNFDATKYKGVKVTDLRD